MTDLPQDAPPEPSSSPAQPTQTSTQEAGNPGSPPVEYFPGLPKAISEEIIVEWTAQSRPHKQRNRQYFTTIAIFVALISMILFFAGQFLPIAVVIAVAFLVYVMEMVPPSLVTHRLTTFGIRIEDSLYYWEEMGRFWFTQRYNQTLLHIEVTRFPGRLTLLTADLDQEALKQVLSEVLIYEQPAKTTYEKIADRLQQLIPLE